MKENSDEIFNCNEENKFDEFQLFKAERYNVNEIIKPPAEIIKTNEIFQDEIKTKANKKKEDLLDRLNKLENANTTNPTPNTEALEVASNAAANSSTIVTHASSTILGTTVAVVSAATIGVIPNVIATPENKIVNVVEASILDNSSINTISVSGLLNDYNDEYKLFVYLDQYNNDELIDENNKIDLFIDNETNEFTFNANALFEANKFQYDIFYLENETEYVIYESDIIDFKFDHDYNARLSYKAPNNSNITINDDSSYNINIDTGFETEYPDIFKYRLEILDNDNNVLDSYIGNEANINLNITTLDNISFRYSTIGIFNDSEHIYNEKIITSDTTIIDESVKNENSFDSIQISGSLFNIDLERIYFVEILQYVNSEIIDVSTNTLEIINNSFNINNSTSYGIDSYQYNIYYLDNKEDRIILYESDIIEYNENQEYNATIEYISPIDSSINLNDNGKYNISINTNFNTNYPDVFKYKLEILDSDNNVLDSYIGNEDNITLVLDDISNISFRYSTIGIFNNYEHIYNEEIITSDTSIVDVTLKTINSFDSIQISGSLLNIRDNITYNIELIQYNGNDTLDISSNELVFENNKFSSNNSTFYGLDSYQYNIYYLDNKEERVILYESNIIEYSESQEFNATIDYISPIDSTINFNEDGTYTIDINTNFKTNYPNVFKYKVEVLDEEKTVLNSYSGNEDNISIDISTNGKIYFKYSTIGIFNNIEHIYESNEIDAYSLIETPSITLDKEYSFDGEYFNINYQLESNYNLENMILELKIVSNEFGTINKKITNLENSGVIILDDIASEPKDISIIPTLTFNDDRLDKNNHSVIYEEILYSMNYELNIVEFDADLVNLNEYNSSGNEDIIFRFNMNYILPNSYKIKITSSGNEVNDLIDLANETTSYQNKISYTAGDVIIQILDSNDNPYKDEIRYNILTNDEIQTKYTDPETSLAPNPGDAIVTYNDDGTINLYRDTNFSASDPNVYYDSFIYSGESTDSNGITIYKNSYHDLSQKNCSVIENITEDTYTFNYFLVVKYNNVYYYIERNYPSGGLSFDYSFDVTASYDETTNKTSITLVNNNYIYLHDIVDINGTEYNIVKSYSDASLEVDGNVIGQELTIYGTDYYGNDYNYLNDNYQSFAQEKNITIKGNIYKKYKLTIS